MSKTKTKGMSGGASVYALADVPPPAIPGPVPAPGACSDFVAELQANGTLLIKFASNNPPGASGTVYQVFRRNTPSGAFTYLGGAGTKEFLDATIPAGSSQVTYQVQAVRSTAAGPWAEFNVNFGVSTGGTMTASVSETPGPKIAARASRMQNAE